MDKQAIMRILPHRDDMLLIDRAEVNEAGEAIGTYIVRGDEYFLRGHFPGNPVVPGVILCEIIGQTACVLVQDVLKGRTPYYAGIEKVRFKRKVLPGDTIRTVVRPLRHKLNVYVVSGEAWVGDTLCAGGEFIFMIV